MKCPICGADSNIKTSVCCMDEKPTKMQKQMEDAVIEFEKVKDMFDKIEKKHTPQFDDREE